MKKNRPVVVLMTVIILISLISCVNKPDEIIDVRDNPEDQEKIILRFISSWGVDSKAETLQEVLVQFTKENENIEIVNESLFGEDFLPKIKQILLRAIVPMCLDCGRSDIRALIRAGKVADLSGLMEKTPNGRRHLKGVRWNIPHMTENIRLPFETIFEVLFINKDLFELYSVPVPETYEQLKMPLLCSEKWHCSYCLQFPFRRYISISKHGCPSGRQKFVENPSHPELGNITKPQWSICGSFIG